MSYSQQGRGCSKRACQRRRHHRNEAVGLVELAVSQRLCWGNQERQHQSPHPHQQCRWGNFKLFNNMLWFLMCLALVNAYDHNFFQIYRCDDVPLHRNCRWVRTSNGNQPLGSLPAHQSAVASVETWWTGQNHQLVFNCSHLCVFLQQILKLLKKLLISNKKKNRLLFFNRLGD